jgi:hypothetical protein
MSRALSAEVGPDGQPPRFDGAAWVSQDGRYWWNGAGWQPVARPKRFRPSVLVIVLAVFIFAAVGYMAFNLAHRVNELFAGEGVSNAKIDSPTEFEFDYLRGSTCNDLTFQYDFFDKSGNHVDVFHDLTGGKVDGGVLTHFDIKGDASQPIDGRAVRFEAKATCHD